MKVHREAFTVDSHTDTPMWFTRSEFDFGKRHDPVKDRSRVDLPRMEEGGLDAVFLAVFTGQGERNDTAYEKVYNYALRVFDSIYSVANQYQDIAAIATTSEDGFKLEEEHKKALYIGMENGYPIGEDLAKVEEFYNLGARYITLCHTRNNQICDSSTDSTEHNGLSSFGREVLAEMNRLGLMIDVSHISDSSFYDVIKYSKAPVIASHSCARALCDNPRNLSDDMLIKLAENGGVIQFCILSSYVKTPEPNPLRDSLRAAVRKKYRGFRDLSDEELKDARRDWYAIDTIAPRKLATVSDAVDHIDHIVNLVGIEHVGIGTDFDGGGALADCLDVSELPNITKELLVRGYAEEDIRKIWGENLMRVLGQVEITRDTSRVTRHPSRD
jgi:membrane dipeptidase